MSSISHNESQKIHALNTALHVQFSQLLKVTVKPQLFIASCGSKSLEFLVSLRNNSAQPISTCDERCSIYLRVFSSSDDLLMSEAHCHAFCFPFRTAGASSNSITIESNASVSVNFRVPLFFILPVTVAVALVYDMNENKSTPCKFSFFISFYYYIG